MALTNIEYGSLASSSVMNSNFEYLDNRISSVSQTVSSNNAAVYSSIASVNSLIASTSDIVRPVGQPIIRLDNTLLEDEIRLEGAVVSRTTYSALFEKYGITYGEGDGSTTFKLPDFRDRVFWGSDEFGYLEAKLPNISGTFGVLSSPLSAPSYSGAVSPKSYPGSGVSHNNAAHHKATIYEIDASVSSSIYSDETDTVQPPSVQIRVVTRYK